MREPERDGKEKQSGTVGVFEKYTRSGFCVNRRTNEMRIMKVVWGHGGDQSDPDPSFQGGCRV